MKDWDMESMESALRAMSLERQEKETLASGALQRMQKRYENAMRFIKKNKEVKANDDDA